MRKYKIFLVGLFLLVMTATVYAEHQTRVIDGSTVSENDPKWKFIVALKKDKDHFCGASLIDEKWILTAAHCLSDESGDPLLVTTEYTAGMGSYNINDTKDYAVKRFIVHPQYDAITTDNDIALIELKEKVSNIPTIAYDTNNTLSTGTRTSVAGWGNMSRDDGDAYPDNLREAIVPIVDFDSCNSRTSYDGDLTENMICAGYMDGRKDGCQGDSGGPLIINNTLVGIVSWGNGCGKKNYPGVYTKVQNYVKWIRKYVPVPKKKKWAPIIVDDITTFIPVK